MNLKAMPQLNEQYQIVECISDGSYCTVYLGKDLVRQRDILVKIFKSKKVWNAIYTNRQHLLDLRSYQMPVVYDIDSINGNDCLIEQFIQGESLASHIKSNRLTFRMFFSILRDLLDAVQALHRINLVHGDISPENVIVRIEGDDARGYLVDVDSAFVNLANESAFFGTLSFSAPEQLVAGKALPASDIYSLGLLTYYILEGCLPFAKNRDGIKEKVNGNISLALERVNDIPIRREIEALLNQMTSLSLFDRPDIIDIKEKLDILSEKNSMKDVIDLFIRKPMLSSSLETEEESFSFTSQAVKNTFFVTHILNSTFAENDYRRKVRWWQKSNAKRESFEQKTNDRIYQRYLLREYEQLSLQASISFWLWVTTFLLGLVLVVIAVCLIIQQKYVEAVTSVVLEALVYFAQRLFAVREEYYRKQNDNKLKHLEAGDYFEYYMSILDTTSKEYREKRIDMLWAAIQRVIPNK